VPLFSIEWVISTILSFINKWSHFSKCFAFKVPSQTSLDRSWQHEFHLCAHTSMYLLYTLKSRNEGGNQCPQTIASNSLNSHSWECASTIDLFHR
jgi:hypothetical protein